MNSLTSVGENIEDLELI